MFSSILLKKLPIELHRQLKAEAAKCGMSLELYVISLLEKRSL